MKKSISFLTLAILTLLCWPAFSVADVGNMGEDPNNALGSRSGVHAGSPNDRFLENPNSNTPNIRCSECNRFAGPITGSTAALPAGAEESGTPGGTDGVRKGP